MISWFISSNDKCDVKSFYIDLNWLQTGRNNKILEDETMEMSYGGALVMPSNYAIMNEEEMTYLEGGALKLLGTISADKCNKMAAKVAIGASIFAILVGAGTVLGVVANCYKVQKAVAILGIGTGVMAIAGGTGGLVSAYLWLAGANKGLNIYGCMGMPVAVKIKY